MKKIDLTKVQTAHFIGIGGIGVSAIATMMLLEGKRVSGSDSAESKVTEELRKAGAVIHMGHRTSNIPENCDLVVYTIAVNLENPECAEAIQQKIPVLTYPEMLGRVSAHKYTIAIAGTHGKTTTTAMIAQILIEAKKEPTVIVGSLLKDVHSNFVAGRVNSLW